MSMFLKVLWKQTNIIPQIQLFLWRIAQMGYQLELHGLTNGGIKYQHVLYVG
jgi:hypothetical protein